MKVPEIKLLEKPESRRFAVREEERMYILTGTSDENAAREAVYAITPSTIPRDEGFLIRTGVEIQPDWVDTVADDGHWQVTVHYGVYDIQSPQQPTGGSSFSFDMGGGTQHITASYGCVGYPVGAPDTGKVIGGRPDGDPTGTDIVVPVYNFTEIYYLPNSVVNGAYKIKLFTLTGTTNNAPWKGLDTGECLFLGASGSKRGTEDWEISFRFAASLNRENMQIGLITGINAKGWEILDIRHEPKVIGTGENKILTSYPKFVYVHEVYPPSNFADLGIGV